jgi:hypothetical protein
MIIGGMMHPYGTVMYAGPGMYANNSVLYPNGQVVNQQGVLVGTYINGVFTPVENGAIVAQQIPADAGAQSTPIANTGPSVTQILTICVLVLLSVILILVIVGMFI